MTKETNLKRPIGYWLKQVDQLLTERIDEAQAVHGVTRTDWQILNLLKENGRASDELIFSVMHTFVDAAKFQEIIYHLIDQGWIDETLASGELQLTCAGYDQHARIFATQKEVRQRAMQGVIQEDYVTVIRVLQQMVENLRPQFV